MCSEEYPGQSYPGSFLFSQPSEIDDWCQSIPSGPEFPITPPASDCAFSDLDMNTQWSHPSLSEETWYTGLPQENGTYMQPSGTAWDQRTMLPSQDLQPLESGVWTHLAPGPVDLGLSPTLSYQSQSTRTLNAFSEPDVSVLPPSLDLSFASEPVWGHAGPIEHQRPQLVQPPLPGNGFVLSPDEMPMRPITDMVYPQWPTTHGTYQMPAQPMLLPRSIEATRPVYPQLSVAPGRVLLPRTEAPVLATSPAQPLAPSQRPIRPLIQGRVSSRNSAHSVSNCSGVAHDLSLIHI